MGKLLFLVSIVYFYFNLNEYLVPAYKLKTFEARHLQELFVGEHAFMFWSVQLLGLIIPMILLLFKQMRKPFPMVIIAIVVLIASWFKTPAHCRANHGVTLPAANKMYRMPGWFIIRPSLNLLSL